MNAKNSILLVVLVTALLSPSVAFAISPDEAAISASMTKMEDRLLDRDYHKETDDQRLERLEKFVFGGPETGTVQARVERLQAAIVPTKPDSTTAALPSAKGTTSSAKQMATAAASTGKAYDASDYGSYPRVAQLEEQFFGKSFASDALPVRIARLETKQFGKPSPDEDMCCRMDRLDKIALKSPPSSTTNSQALADGGAPNMTPLGMNRGFQNSSDDSDAPAKPAIQNPFAPGAIAIKGAEQRCSTLEKFVFGHEHIGKPLAERVAKLEKKLVPYEHDASRDIPSRIDHLWTMLDAANTMNSPQTSTD